MSAEFLLHTVERDAMARLKWCVLRRLGVCPVSLRAMFLSRRRVLRLAAHLVLDGNAKREEETPAFDMARFRSLAGGR